MGYKKRWILFGILFILLINILFVSALGSAASLGGNIDIPLGNQTFPNETISPDNSDDTDYVEDIDDVDSIDDYENELEIDENEGYSDYLENPVTNATTNNITINPGTQSSTASSSSTNSNSLNKFVRDFVEKINPKKNNEDIRDEEKKTTIEPKIKEENINSKKVYYNQKDVKIVLIINTLCLFFAFVTLRNYSKSLKED